MKSTETFKKTILAYLESLASSDELFRVKFKNPDKNIEDCITYILNTVKDSGCNGFEDDEIYNMAIHYYDEANIKIGERTNAQVVVNHVVQLTDEEKKEAKEKAIEQLIKEEKNRLQKKRNPITAVASNVTTSAQTTKRVFEKTETKEVSTGGQGSLFI